ncbi:MAG: alanine racemase C-terminal domain-containing protein [Flavonifractor plautii]
MGSARPVVLRRPTRVAVLPVGYQNGFGVARAQGGGLGALLRRWLAARRRTVRVNGQRARILGAIGAIETVVDVTDLKCSAGDPAVFDIDPLYARGCGAVPAAAGGRAEGRGGAHTRPSDGCGGEAALGCRLLQQTKRREFERCAQLLPE